MNHEMNGELSREAREGNDRLYAPTKRLAASWYVAMPSKALRTKPVPLTMFGRDLVAWRDAAGRPVLMDRYCSHLGASLANGQVVDGCVQCPFHGWRYDTSGRCVYVPTDRPAPGRCERIPPAARQSTYPALERYGYVWGWYGSAAPQHPLPPFLPAESDRFVCLRFVYPSTTSVLRIVENFYDAQHANPVHALPITSFDLHVFDDAKKTDDVADLARTGAWFGAGIDFGVDRYFGPMGMAARALGLEMNQMNLRFDGYPAGCVMTVRLDGELKYKLLQAVTPVRDGETVMHMTIGIQKRSGLARQLADVVLFGLQTKVAAGYDVAIWNGMKADGGGAYSRYDRLVLKYRAFYNRWVDRVDRATRSEAHAPGVAMVEAPT